MKSSPPLYRDPVHRPEQRDPATFGYFWPVQGLYFPCSPLRDYVAGVHNRCTFNHENVSTAISDLATEERTSLPLLRLPHRSFNHFHAIHVERKRDTPRFAGLKFALPSWKVNFKKFLFFFFRGDIVFYQIKKDRKRFSLFLFYFN